MASQSGVGLTKAGKVFVTLVVIVLAVVGIYLMRDRIFPKGKQEGAKDIDIAQAQKMLTGGNQAEDPSTAGITTQTEYKYVPGEKLPPVTGASAYKWNKEDPTVVFPINVWIGWMPIVAANHGFKPNTESEFYKKYKFKVELKLIDDPIAARAAYSAGDSHILWGTLDMIALFAPELMKDSRTAPRVYQQIDWSNGGDGIVARDNIKTVADLKGKTIVYAQNSPSQYYLNTLLLSAGVQPREVNSKFTQTAFEASAAFVSDKSVDACVSWAPDIYNITDKVPGTWLMSSTKDASKVIADVWAARADFAKDHPEVIKGLVEGIFSAMERLGTDDGFRDQACKWLADGYGLPVEDIKGMLADAHSTNFAENKQFFLNANNATNFERTWQRINYVYKELGKIDKPVAFDQVMDFSVLKKLGEEGKFAQQKDEYTAKFVPSDWGKVAESPVLTQTIRIHFFPNSAKLDEPARDEQGNVVKGKLYDPTVPETLERVATLAGQFDRAVIKITGHTDSSMKGSVPQDLVQKLSEERARAVMKALVDKYGFDANKLRCEGKAWDKPADPNDPNNHAQNRRVEVEVFPLEQ
jgi:NitT/TauT family transport system substrate-binding protein